MDCRSVSGSHTYSVTVQVKTNGSYILSNFPNELFITIARKDLKFSELEK